MALQLPGVRPIQNPVDIANRHVQANQMQTNNALINDAQRMKNQGLKTDYADAEKLKIAREMKVMSERGKEMMKRGVPVESFRNDLADWFMQRGMDVSRIPEAGSDPREFMEGFDNLGRSADDIIAALGPAPKPTTYSQPVTGLNAEGNPELYRPDSTGGLNATGVGAPDKASLVSINNPAEQAGLTQEQRALATHRVGKFTKISDAAMAAEGTLNTIDQMRLIDFEGGPGTDFKNNLRRFVMAIGGSEFVDVSEVNDAASFTGLAYREFLNIMSEQKGPQTDNDFLRIKQTFATVTDPEITRDFLMSSAYALASRKMEMSQFWEEYLETNEGSLDGVERAWNNYKATTPMVTDAFLDPNSGLPVFYIDFKDRMKVANPGVSDERIIAEWRKRTGGGAK